MPDPAGRHFQAPRGPCSDSTGSRTGPVSQLPAPAWCRGGSASGVGHAAPPRTSHGLGALRHGPSLPLEPRPSLDGECPPPRPPRTGPPRVTAAHGTADPLSRLQGGPASRAAVVPALLPLRTPHPHPLQGHQKPGPVPLSLVTALTTAPRLTQPWPRWPLTRGRPSSATTGVPVSPPSSRVSPDAVRSHRNAASSEQPSRTAAPTQHPLLQCCPLWLCAYFLLYQEGRELPEGAWSPLSPQHKAWHAARITGQSETQRLIPHLPRGWSTARRQHATGLRGQANPSLTAAPRSQARCTESHASTNKGNDPLSHKGKPPDSWF